MRDVLSSIESEYRRYKTMAERSLEQVDEAELHQPLSPDGNSIAVIMAHIAGNLRSRFTDFLTADGEKAWRDRDSEFVDAAASREALLRHWNEGFTVLFSALSALSDTDLMKRVAIRGEDMAVHDALHRNLAHTSSHVGQVVLLAKAFRDTEWRTLSIPKARPHT